MRQFLLLLLVCNLYADSLENLPINFIDLKSPIALTNKTDTTILQNIARENYFLSPPERRFYLWDWRDTSQEVSLYCECAKVATQYKTTSCKGSLFYLTYLTLDHTLEIAQDIAPCSFSYIQDDNTLIFGSKAHLYVYAKDKKILEIDMPKNWHKIPLGVGDDKKVGVVFYTEGESRYNFIKHINIFRFDRSANILKRYAFTGEFGDMYLRGIDTSFRYIQACKVPDDEEYDEKGQCFLFDIESNIK
ncbi:hypothetical protein CCZ01_09510 [Helicobacter monodelphidis]|uniref:Uncharacterized protein n=1 Tax=Helicobacter didelphidarum TaxID=2040648 RepID=A0A3D8I8P5_9HELI|nr:MULTISPECIES: hypothetical protein [Helicobacter]RAX56440.1 hypothetical protein CCZ01_09510 [Helicobacter sp. 15-1451]RDU61540.1 hypothetical protein CQA53_09970 [Helicobacter didelphidarum]